jgi:hypothetical protein
MVKGLVTDLEQKKERSMEKKREPCLVVQMDLRKVWLMGLPMAKKNESKMGTSTEYR